MIWNYSCVVGIVWFEFAKIKGTKIILHVKSPTFKAAKFNGFTVTAVDFRQNYYLQFMYNWTLLELVTVSPGTQKTAFQQYWGTCSWFWQAQCPSCHQTTSVMALKGKINSTETVTIHRHYATRSKQNVKLWSLFMQRQWHYHQHAS